MDKEESKTNATNIEWVLNPDGSQGYTWNPVTGCLNNCGYCYARKLANGRLKSRYLEQRQIGNRIDGSEWPWQEEPSNEYLAAFNDPFYPRFWHERIEDIIRGYHYTDWSGACEFGAAPKGIFVCDMGDLFGIGIPEAWTRKVLEAIKKDRINRFYLLTKQPQNLIKFSPFPENCWVGITITNQRTNGSASLSDSLRALIDVDAKVKFVSFEPLLEEINVSFYPDEIQWLIIGACTGRSPDLLKLQQQYPSLTLMPYGHQWTAQPKIEWVREIVEAADKAGIKVFLKDNLKPLIKWPEDAPWAFESLSNMLRQEMP